MGAGLTTAALKSSSVPRLSLSVPCATVELSLLSLNRNPEPSPFTLKGPCHRRGGACFQGASQIGRTSLPHAGARWAMLGYCKGLETTDLGLRVFSPGAFASGTRAFNRAAGLNWS